MEDISKVVVQEDFSYGPHDLQSLTVYNPVGSQHKEDGYFIIYIHGGAWRDPLITASSIIPTLQHLLASPSLSPLLASNIKATASLNYRLSPHPSFPQEPPPSTPSSEYRDAKHPDHLLDVLTGIELLQKKYAFGTRYILAGHSCGATLALQILMRGTLLSPTQLTPFASFSEPEIIVGVAGIYDLRLLRDSNSHPAYQEFLAGAFSSSEAIWDAVSPALANPTPAWKAGKILALVSSTGDELVDPGQIEAMGKSAKDWDVTVKGWKGMLSVGHDEIWSEGKGLGEVLGRVLREFFAGKAGFEE